MDALLIERDRVVTLEARNRIGALFVQTSQSVTNVMAQHLLAADPHPQYMTAAEVAADFQPLDSDLTAIAQLSTTAYGRAFLALADAAALRTAAGLPNVDNTSDASKPVSTAQAAADAVVLASAHTYADGLVVGLLDDRGNYNASGNTWPASGGSGSAGAILKGDLWTISVAGTLGGTAVGIGDVIRALADTPGQTAANWVVTENNLGYVPENSANKAQANGYASLDPNSKITLSQTRRLTRTAVKTGAYTASANELVPCDTSSGSFPVNLPNAPEDSSQVVVKHIVQGAGNYVGLACQGADVINKTGGSTTMNLPFVNQAVWLQYDAGTRVWTILSDDIPPTELLLAWAYAGAFRIVTGTRDANGALTSATIAWPDGASGTFTADTLNTSFPGAVDAWHATYVVGAITKTVTQPLVTRDATTGAVTAQPAITIA
jgi:hypothetical protein